MHFQEIGPSSGARRQVRDCRQRRHRPPLRAYAIQPVASRARPLRSLHPLGRSRHRDRRRDGAPPARPGGDILIAEDLTGQGTPREVGPEARVSVLVPLG